MEKHIKDEDGGLDENTFEFSYDGFIDFLKKNKYIYFAIIILLFLINVTKLLIVHKFLILIFCWFVFIISAIMFGWERAKINHQKPPSLKHFPNHIRFSFVPSVLLLGLLITMSIPKQACHCYTHRNVPMVWGSENNPFCFMYSDEEAYDICRDYREQILK